MTTNTSWIQRDLGSTPPCFQVPDPLRGVQLGLLITCTRSPLLPLHGAGINPSLAAALIKSRHLRFKQATLVLSAAALSARQLSLGKLRRAAASKLLLVWLTPQPVTVVQSRPPPHKGSFALMLSEADPRLMMLYFPACLTVALWLL